MDPYVLRLVSRGKTPQTSRLEHIPKLWLRAPVRVELACSGPEDSAAALAAVSNYSLAIHSLDADRKPVDSPLLWYQVVGPAGNTGATKGPHAVFEIGTAEIANITEAGDYWIAVHAHTVDERIVRAAGYVTLLDDGYPSTPPTPTPPGTVWLTQAAGDARYVNVTGDIMTGTLTLPAAGLRHAASGFDAVVIAATLTNDRELLLPDEDGTLATREWALANISGTGGGATNITISLSSTTVTVNSSTGTEETIPGATNALAGIMTAAHVISLDGKVNKSGDTMTGLLTLPDITVTNSAIFGPALAHNEISTVATAVRENQLPDANGVFALTSNTEGVPDKLGTRAKCSVAGGVTKGKVVFLNNADGNNPTFALANATSDATSSKTYGFIDRACALNQHGVIITNGLLEGLSLAVPYALPGDSVWLSTVNGGVEVGLPPAKPAHSVYLGLATKVSNSGYSNAVIQTIEVKVQNGYELAELHDVAATVASADQALVWNSSTNLWTPTTLTISLVSGLQTALDGKAASSHTHAIGDVTGLQTALDGKAPTASPVFTGTVSLGSQFVLDDPGSSFAVYFSGSAPSDDIYITFPSASGTLALTSHTHELTGAVTGSGSGTISTTLSDGAVTNAKIASAAVTYTKIQNVIGFGVLCNPGTSPGVVQEATLGTDQLLGRAGSGNIGGVACTAAGRALLDDSTPQEQVRTLTTISNRPDTNASFALSDADNGAIIITTATSAINITVPATLSAGFTCLIIQGGTGQVTFVGSGTTVNSYNNLLKTAGIYAGATLIRTPANTFVVVGALA